MKISVGDDLENNIEVDYCLRVRDFNKYDLEEEIFDYEVSNVHIPSGHDIV